ncbi:MAG: NAD(P)/FAD-dependent oxidoreductase [Dermatophilaceae bacterium]
MGEEADVLVIGAGPGGLAVAGALAMRGRGATVLERADDVAESWRHHYERLHLHTPRRLSGLPGMPIPREFGRWVARDDVVRYLERYRDHHGIDVHTGIDVARIDRAPRGWTVRATDGREFSARHIVVATGHNHTPVLPAWPGQESFPGAVVHAADYRNPRPYAARSVLVVGTGNTGCEIAQDLADGGASAVWLAYRSLPHIVRRTTFGWPAQATGIAVRHLPTRVVDRIARVTARVEVPDLTAYGLPRPATGLFTRVKEGAIPVQDVGIVAAIEARRVVPVPTIERFDGAEVVLVDGRRLRPDVVLVAAGYRNGLGPLVGHLGVLGSRGNPVVTGGHEPPGAPGLWFTGYTNPISGMFRELRVDAKRIAKAVAG